MRINDIVTVKTPTIASESGFLDNPEFTVMPGMPCVLHGTATDWNHETGVLLSTKVGPRHRLNIPWYVATTPDNITLIAKSTATSFNTSKVHPDYVGEVTRLLQSNIKTASVLTMAKTMNQTYGHGKCYDRWGRLWTNERLYNLMIEDAQRRGGDFSQSLIQAMHAMCVTHRFSDVDPDQRTEPKVRPTKGLYVNVYHLDRYYKGPEEGGIWRDEEWPVEWHRVSRKAANQLLRQKQQECDENNEGTPPISSVLSQGKYRVRVERLPGYLNTPPPYHYE
jgi:hypothetical protein